MRFLYRWLHNRVEYLDSGFAHIAPGDMDVRVLLREVKMQEEQNI